MKKFVCNTADPVVKTAEGLLRGFVFDGIYNFRGIRYGVADRFMMPRDVEPWEGVKDALVWGFTAPTPTVGAVGDDFTVPHRFWPQSEDCLYLNIWTDQLNPEAKKPVMVWIHGGGYYNGSSMEMIAYDGDELARHKDVVLVSVNHRLNHLGFMDLSSFGEKYQNSGNAGMADLVQALKWVQRNIAAFGGDPDNVTIFGQSGGGGKVTTLLQIPEANGLFHKAVVQSGVFGGMPGQNNRDDAAIARKMMEILGVDDVSGLETAPLSKLQEAYILANTDAHGGVPDLMMNGPVANGWYVGDPMEVGFTEHAKTIPMMVGTVSAEMGFRGKLPPRDEMTEAEIREALAAEYGAEHADEVYDAFRAAYPHHSAAYALFVSNRLPTVRYCQKKAACSSSPVFNYNFALVFPFDGGVPAWHCAEIPFVFHTADRLPLYHMEGGEAVQEAVSSAWANFAKNGNPSGGAVGEWPPITAEEENTYVFDFASSAKTAYDHKLMELIEKYQKPRMFF